MARRALRAVAVAAIVVLAATLAVTFTPGRARARSGAQLSTLESGVLAQINFIRTEHGLAPLRLNLQLTEAATEHSQQMGVDGYFQHSSADGSPFWKRIAHFYREADRSYWSVGENLLWSSPGVGPAQALQLWMRSPEHRANILAPRWREIGISAVHFVRAGGPYRGRAVTIVTTDFGVRH